MSSSYWARTPHHYPADAERPEYDRTDAWRHIHKCLIPLPPVGDQHRRLLAQVAATPNQPENEALIATRRVPAICFWRPLMGATDFDPIEIADAIAEIASRTNEPETARQLMEVVDRLLKGAAFPTEDVRRPGFG